MKGHNNMDGAVGFTQCPIPPGGNFTYEFRIADDQHGSYWYHAHSQVQRGDGLYGGLIVHRPIKSGVDDLERYGYEREVLLLVGDWHHRSAVEILAWYTSVGAFGNEVSISTLALVSFTNHCCVCLYSPSPWEWPTERGADISSIALFILWARLLVG
jgi:FtsP/CotA-like multicopper oxidase with cupredoxin domain